MFYSVLLKKSNLNTVTIHDNKAVKKELLVFQNAKSSSAEDNPLLAVFNEIVEYLL